MNRMVPRFLLILTLAVILIETTADSEVYQCGDVLTNRPCVDGTPVVQKKVVEPRSPEEIADEDKKALLSGLGRIKWRLEHDHKILFDLKPVEIQCRSLSVVECAKLVATTQQEMNALIPPPTPIPTTTPKPQDNIGGPTTNNVSNGNNTSVISVIGQSRGIYRRPRPPRYDGRGHWEHGRPPPPIPPQLIPPTISPVARPTPFHW